MTELPTIAGGFGTIVADPPWSFSDKGSRAAPDWKHAKGGYQTLDIAAIRGLPVRAIAAPDAHLYLWTTDSHLPAALSVVGDWGFLYKQTLAWIKRGPSGKLAVGMGHYFRHSHELVLFAVRGRPPVGSHSLPSVFEAPRKRHSEKPARLLELAEAMSPGPRVELFARTRREGWAAWGDQLGEAA